MASIRSISRPKSLAPQLTSVAKMLPFPGTQSPRYQERGHPRLQRDEPTVLSHYIAPPP